MVAIRVHHRIGRRQVAVLVILYYEEQHYRLELRLQWRKAEWNKPFRNVFDRSDRKKFLSKYCLTF
jgi:hypothetical protein